ncbi:MAG: bifunctional shikimate kinase/3-dehydroquinate synthase [Gaiella sp.]
MAAALNALGRHIALAGFMGAGKSTLGPVVAERIGRAFRSADAELEARAGRTIAEIFAVDGEAVFRALEEQVVADLLAAGEPAVIELGGGAVTSAATRELLRRSAFTVLVEIGLDEAWRRAEGSGRPLALDSERFAALYEERQPVYEAVADGHARDADGVVLAAAGVHVETGALEQLGEHVPGTGPVEVVIDRHVSGIHGVTVQLGLGSRDVAVHEVPQGEPAKTAAVLERLWSAFRVGRDGMIVGVGGGATTDVAGLAAATYMRGVPWTAVPTTLVGQVDAGLGGKTAIDLPGAKNIVGAFHWPARVVVDPAVLTTLPEGERLNGMAEVVKTGLLAGAPLWELGDRELVSRCCAYKAAVCLRDPYDQGFRNVLNLGHTFAHALEAAAGYELSHGRAVALGLTAALRLSGLDEERRMVESVLSPEKAAVDRDAAWAALQRDKKATGGSPRLVLLDAPGRPRHCVEVDPGDVRRALDELIA